MKIKIDLHGWADGLSDNPKKVYFPLQLAMYEVMHDCDWHFEVKTMGQRVDEPWTILVKAKRCHSKDIDFDKGIDKSNFTYIEFNFEVPQYTLANVYDGAIKALTNKLKGVKI